MKVKDIMTTNVAYVNPSSTVIETAQLMQKHNIGAIPVCDQNGLIGIVTDRDIVVRNVAHGTNPQSIAVKDIMTSKVKSVTPETDLNAVCEIMAKDKVRRMPVVENNKLVGIVAIGDLATNFKFDDEASEALSEISIPSRPEKM